MKLFQNKMTALRNVVVAATMIVATTTTFAHVSLVSAIPAENASILSQPKNLTLNFGAEVMLMNIKLLDAQRRDVPLKYKVSSMDKILICITTQDRIWCPSHSQFERSVR